MAYSADLVARKVNVVGECWLWTGTYSRTGYGKQNINEAGTVKTIGAHRYSYIAHKGDIPEGYEVDHLCCVRACVNPDHLEAVTPEENRARAVASRVEHNSTVSYHKADGTCGECGEAVPPVPRGRPRSYCSSSCRRRAYRIRM